MGIVRTSVGGGATTTGLGGGGGGALGWKRNGLRLVSLSSRFDVSKELSFTVAGPSDAG
jgi:hypothetical protein